MVIPKPNGYKGHRIVYDPFPILIIDLEDTVFQASMKLGESWQDFSAVLIDDNIIITEID